jgi:hypothetical protein
MFTNYSLGGISQDLITTRSTAVSQHRSLFYLHDHHNLLGFIPVLRLNLFCSQVLMMAPSLSLLISPVI